MAKRNPRRSNGHRRDRLRARHRAAGRDCYICGRPIDYTIKPPDPMSFVVDETIPVCRGGDPYSWTNTHAAHRWCNQVKGARSLDWARAEVRRILNGQGEGTRTRPTMMPYKRLGL